MEYYSLSDLYLEIKNAEINIPGIGYAGDDVFAVEDGDGGRWFVLRYDARPYRDFVLAYGDIKVLGIIETEFQIALSVHACNELTRWTLWPVCCMLSF